MSSSTVPAVIVELLECVPNRVSELRVVELLDGTCEKMQDYTLHKVNVFKIDFFLSNYVVSLLKIISFGFSFADRFKQKRVDQSG